MTENGVDESTSELPERTRARKAAAQYLYAKDLRQEDDLDPDAYLASDELGDDSRQFGRELIEHVRQNLDEIDERIESVSENWQLSRMSVVDRNLIRLGIAEIKFQSETPRPVVINECVELARHMGSSDSHQFVNAILDRIE